MTTSTPEPSTPAGTNGHPQSASDTATQPSDDDVRSALVLARKALMRWDNVALVDEAMARIDFVLRAGK